MIAVTCIKLFLILVLFFDLSTNSVEINSFNDLAIYQIKRKPNKYNYAVSSQNLKIKIVALVTFPLAF